MKNNLKNNWLKCLVMLFAVIFVGNVVAMPQPKSKVEREMRQRAISGVMARVKEKEKKVDKIVKNILWAILSQYQIDHKMPISYPLSVTSYSPAKNVEFSLFGGYKGAMIPIRSGSSVIHIPNYKTVLDQAKYKQIEQMPDDWSSVLNELAKVMPDKLAGVMLGSKSRMELLDGLLKELQQKYDELPWTQRWLQMPW